MIVSRYLARIVPGYVGIPLLKSNGLIGYFCMSSSWFCSETAVQSLICEHRLLSLLSFKQVVFLNISHAAVGTYILTTNMMALQK